METLVYERRGHVGWLRLNRPDRLNALTPLVWSELTKLGNEIGDDPRLRCLVVIGVGRAFSTGLDLDAFSPRGGLLAPGGALSPDGDTGRAPSPSSGRDIDDRLVRGVTDLQEAYTWLADSSYPTIAAIRGFALGGGLQLALACDLRIVARGSQLSLPEHRYGILPDLGGTWWLPRIVGTAKAKEIIWTAEALDADEALRIGLANRICDDDDLEDVVGALAERIAAQPPMAVQGTKRCVDRAAHQSLGEGLREAAVSQAGCLRSKDFAEAVAAFTEKRSPAYQNA